MSPLGGRRPAGGHPRSGHCDSGFTHHARGRGFLRGLAACIRGGASHEPPFRIRMVGHGSRGSPIPSVELCNGLRLRRGPRDPLRWLRRNHRRERPNVGLRLRIERLVELGPDRSPERGLDPAGRVRWRRGSDDHVRRFRWRLGSLHRQDVGFRCGRQHVDRPRPVEPPVGSLETRHDVRCSIRSGDSLRRTRVGWIQRGDVGVRFRRQCVDRSRAVDPSGCKALDGPRVRLGGGPRHPLRRHGRVLDGPQRHVGL